MLIFSTESVVLILISRALALNQSPALLLKISHKNTVLSLCLLTLIKEFAESILMSAALID